MHDLGTFTAAGAGDVSNISKSDVDTIFGASGTGVTVLGEYYPTVTSPQHPTQNDISVHVQSDGYDVIFAVAPINAVASRLGLAVLRALPLICLSKIRTVIARRIKPMSTGECHAF